MSVGAPGCNLIIALGKSVERKPRNGTCYASRSCRQSFGGRYKVNTSMCIILSFEPNLGLRSRG